MILKLINNSSSQLQITVCIPHHMYVFGYPMKTWMKIFKDLDIVSKSLEIWIQYPNVHCFSENHVTSIKYNCNLQ